MEIEGRISILVSSDRIDIEIEDSLSGESLAEVTLTPEVFCAALGRLVMNKCDVKTGDLSKVGKKMKVDKFTFPIPEDADYSTEKEIAKSIAQDNCPEGWEADSYFNSQDSFFNEDGRRWARCTMRKWIAVTG